jgi:hypothetical protein
MAFQILLTVLGLGMLCALLYFLVVFALPVFAGLSVAFWAMNTGAGLGSLAIGLAAGAAVFVAGHIVFSSGRSLILRSLVLLFFAVPAAIATYSMILQLSAIAIPSIVWRHVFALIGASAIGVAAAARLQRPYVEIARVSAIS